MVFDPISYKKATEPITPDRTTFFIKEESENIFNGEYKPWILHTISGGGMRVSKTLGDLRGGLAIVEIKPNTTYTVKSHDKELTDAFRIGLSNRPFEFSSYDIFNLDDFVIMGDTTIPKRRYTLTTTEESQLLFVYVSSEGNSPRLKIEEGENATDYEGNTHIDPKYIKENNNNTPKKRVIPLSAREMYDVPKLEGVNSHDSKYKIHEQNSSSMYALYDELVDYFPNYVTKELLTNETTGKPIYQYVFKPEQPDISRIEMETDLINFLVVSGVHGSEKAGWWCLYETMKQICTNWGNSEVLEALRWNVKFTVVPIVNVYGVDNPDDPVTFNGKINANGVDINRNFPEGFIEGNEGDIGYGGQSPLTEPESIAIASILRNGEIDFYADFHNFSTQPDPNHFMWNILDDEYGLNVSQFYLTHLTQKWKKRDEDFPQSDAIFFGHSGIGTGGSTPPFVSHLGILGGIFEISHTMHPKESNSQYSSEVITLGTEAQINWLYTGYKNVVLN